MRAIGLALGLGAILGAHAATAADAESGRRIAQMRCGTCHILGLSRRQELANSPPFAVIARKYGANQEALVFAILSPHPRMNLRIGRREADDLAAYIGSLAR